MSREHDVGHHEDELFPERFVPGEMHGLIEAEHLARYSWVSAFVEGQRVLDAGCGVGYGSRLLLRGGAMSVTGVDIAQQAIDAASVPPQQGLSFLVGDMSELPLADASVEVAVCFEAIEHVHDQDRALDELRRVLTPDGWLAISSPNREIYEKGNPYHTHEYTPEELRSALSGRFRNVALERQQAWLASVIGGEQTMGEHDPTQRLSIDVAKVAALDSGHETFVLALASDGRLPTPRSLAILTDLDELSDWIKRARSAEEHLARAEDGLREVEASHRTADAAYRSAAEAYATIERSHEEAQAALERSRGEASQSKHELYRSRTMLAERNATLRLATEELRSLQQREGELEAALQASTLSLEQLRRSLSWRITGPLRALGRHRSVS